MLSKVGPIPKEIFTKIMDLENRILSSDKSPTKKDLPANNYENIRK